MVDDIDKRLAHAKQLLADFDDSITANERIAQLKHASAGHPVLLAKSLFILLGLVSTLGFVVVLAAPMAGRDMAVTMARYGGMFLPVMAFGAALTCFGLAAGSHVAAISLGANYPLLPAQAKARQRLQADVQQLESQKKMQRLG